MQPRLLGAALLALWTLLFCASPVMAAAGNSSPSPSRARVFSPRAQRPTDLVRGARRALRRVRLTFVGVARRLRTFRPVAAEQGRQGGALSQFARGLAQGARETWKELQAHPLRTLAVTVGIGALSLGLEALSLPAQPILFGVGAVLTAKAVAHEWPRLRAAFAEHRVNRFAVVGETAFPVLAYGLATGLCQGLGSLAKGLEGSSARLLGVGRGVAMGLHLVDDLPAATMLLRRHAAR